MRRYRPVLVQAIALFLAGAIQQALAPRMSILGAVPDFILVVVICVSLMSNRPKGAIVGFAGGVIEGALAGANTSAYAISRTLAGFCASWSKVLGFEMSLLAVGVAAFFSTILAETIWMFIGLRSGVGGFLAATIGTAVYNGVLAMPLYALLKRLAESSRK